MREEVSDKDVLHLKINTPRNSTFVSEVLVYIAKICMYVHVFINS